MTWAIPGRVLAIVAGAAVAPFWLQGTAAQADGSGGCSFDGVCTVADTRPRVPPRDSGTSKPPAEDRLPDLPDCADFDDARMDIPPDASNPADWVQVACLEGSLRLTLWVEGRATPEQVARSLLARVELKPISIGLVPKDPDAMTVVGLPVWLWVDEPSRTTWGPATIAAGGVSLTATVESVTWEMGDGTTLTCGKGTAWKRGMGADPSPTCGHTYVEQGRYTIRARSHWVARWSGYGQSGTIPVTLSTTRQLDVGEIQVIVTGG